MTNASQIGLLQVLRPCLITTNYYYIPALDMRIHSVVGGKISLCFALATRRPVILLCILIYFKYAWYSCRITAAL